MEITWPHSWDKRSCCCDLNSVPCEQKVFYSWDLEIFRVMWLLGLFVHQVMTIIWEQWLKRKQEQCYNSIQWPSEHGYNEIRTLPKKNMAGGSINIIICWFPTVDHKTIHKFHGLCTLASQLSGNHNFTALCSTLHDETQYAITCPVKPKQTAINRPLPWNACMQQYKQFKNKGNWGI